MPKSEQQQQSHNHIINNNWKWRKSAKLVSAGLTKAARLCFLTHSHTHSPQQFRKATTRLLEYQGSAKIKKRIGKNINKNKRIQRFQTNQHQQQLRRVGGSRRACAGCTHSPRLWLVCLSLACVTSSLWTPPHPTPPPSVYMYSNCETPIPLVSVLTVPVSLFLLWVVRQGMGAYWDKIRFHSNRCTLLIYQHFCGICDAFLRNYLSIIRLFEIFVSSTHSITHRYLCLHGYFLCLIECVSISYLFGEYLPRIWSHKRVLRSSCLA